MEHGQHVDQQRQRRSTIPADTIAILNETESDSAHANQPTTMAGIAKNEHIKMIFVAPCTPLQTPTLPYDLRWLTLVAKKKCIHLANDLNAIANGKPCLTFADDPLLIARVLAAN